MTSEKTKEIFENVADAMEISVNEVVARFKSDDADVVKFVSFALKMDAL